MEITQWKLIIDYISINKKKLITVALVFIFLPVLNWVDKIISPILFAFACLVTNEYDPNLYGLCKICLMCYLRYGA